MLRLHETESSYNIPTACSMQQPPLFHFRQHRLSWPILTLRRYLDLFYLFCNIFCYMLYDLYVVCSFKHYVYFIAKLLSHLCVFKMSLVLKNATRPQVSRPQMKWPKRWLTWLTLSTFRWWKQYLTRNCSAFFETVDVDVWYCFIVFWLLFMF